METVPSPKSGALKGQLGNSRGFSLIEMAIVLVIIGLIVGAIVKGQDLILNSRAKHVTTAITTWRNLAAAYLDRNGRLPGDSDLSGFIGDSEQTAPLTATTELESAMTNAPNNPVTVGGMSFFVYFGNVAGTTSFRNVIVVCKDATCGTAFSTDELEIIKAVDTAIDGSADGGTGQFRLATGATLVGGLAATAGGRAEDVITAAAGMNKTAGGAAVGTVPWGATAKAAVWSFDRPW